VILYIVRHGLPVYAPEEKLTEYGHRQANALVPRFRDVGLTRICSSPLRRARETAQPTADALGLPIQIEDWMSEDLSWQRFTKPDTRNSWGDAWVWDCVDPGELVRDGNRTEDEVWNQIEAMQSTPTAREGYRQLAADSDAFLASLGYQRVGNEYKILSPSDERVACFCHQGFGLTWLSHLLRIPPHIFWTEFDITHTGVTVLDFCNHPGGFTVPKCLCLSDMSHLFADPDLNMKYHQEFDV